MDAKLPTIIDNREPNTVFESLKRLLPESKTLDVATGFFEIGSLLSLDGFWNLLEGIRIIMGDETQRRTRKELVENIKRESVLEREIDALVYKLYGLTEEEIAIIEKKSS